jgi:hypothetical protein
VSVRRAEEIEAAGIVDRRAGDDVPDDDGSVFRAASAATVL